jgi:hypothetical protein
MNPLELRDFKSDSKAFMNGGPLVIDSMPACAPARYGGIAVDATDQLELVKYVPANAQRTLYLKAEKLVLHQHLRDPIRVFDPPNYRLLNGYIAHVSFHCNYERTEGGTKSFVTHELWTNFVLP